jgi:hypothetical protein
VAASIIAGKPIRTLCDEGRFPDGSLHARRFASFRNFRKAIPAASHSPHETPPQNPYHRLRFIIISQFATRAFPLAVTCPPSSLYDE